MVSTFTSNLFVSVIESHKGILFKIANAYCRDPENRNDLIQEIIFSCGNHLRITTISTNILPGSTGLP
ncbi:MAG: hypothetical protein WCI31_09165 [Prolixibacteraceae bacterium]